MRTGIYRVWALGYGIREKGISRLYRDHIPLFQINQWYDKVLGCDSDVGLRVKSVGFT